MNFKYYNGFVVDLYDKTERFLDVIKVLFNAIKAVHVVTLVHGSDHIIKIPSHMPSEGYLSIN